MPGKAAGPEGVGTSSSMTFGNNLPHCAGKVELAGVQPTRMLSDKIRITEFLGRHRDDYDLVEQWAEDAIGGNDAGERRLRVVSGLWLRTDTVVPFGRVQHIDLDRVAEGVVRAPQAGGGEGHREHAVPVVDERAVRAAAVALVRSEIQAQHRATGDSVVVVPVLISRAPTRCCRPTLEYG